MLYQYEFLFLKIEGGDTPVLSSDIIEAEDLDEAVEELQCNHPRLYKILKCYEIIKKRVI